MQLMYLLFRDHNMKPSEVYRMKRGELEVLRSFIKYENEERVKEYEAMKGDS